MTLICARNVWPLLFLLLLPNPGVADNHDNLVTSLARSVQQQRRREYVEGGGLQIGWKFKLVLGVTGLLTAQALGYWGDVEIQGRLGIALFATSLALVGILTGERVVFRNWGLHDNEKEIARLQGELSRAEAGEVELSDHVKKSGEFAIEQADWKGYPVELLRNESAAKKLKWRRKLGQWSLAEGLGTTAYIGGCIAGLKLMGGL